MSNIRPFSNAQPLKSAVSAAFTRPTSPNLSRLNEPWVRNSRKKRVLKDLMPLSGDAALEIPLDDPE